MGQRAVSSTIETRSHLITQIEELKKERKAVILVHNYQRGEVQDIADFRGDSLGLSQCAARTKAEVIVFCGVHFMAETAAILNPDKIVLLPDENAGCPMADMITASQLREKKRLHPRAKVVCYVNTTAEVKAESDICCTSANAVEVISSFPPEEEIIFVPDKYLGAYVMSRTGRKLILWNGYCPTHVQILPEDILHQKSLHPEAKVVVHPECRPEVIALADEVRSTTGICRDAQETNTREIIVGTETGILYRLAQENPDKIFYPASERAICPNMKLINLEKVLWALQDLQPRVEVGEEIRQRALKAVNRMLVFGG